MKTVKCFGDFCQRVSHGETNSKLMFSVDTLQIYIGETEVLVFQIWNWHECEVFVKTPKPAHSLR